MNPVTIISSFMLVLGLIVASNVQVYAQRITGVWINAAEDTKVLIYKGRKDTKKARYNEDPTKYYGKVVWSKNNKVKKGDKIIVQFSPYGPDTYKGGKIIHIANGKSYEGYLQLRTDGKLKIRKYVNKTIVGTTEIWAKSEG